MSGHIKILDVKIDRADNQESLRQIAAFLQSPGCKQIVTVNPEYVMLAQESPRLLRLLNRTELSVPDGIGIIWASRLLGQPLQDRITGSDLLPQICGLCADRGYSIFLLGGQPGVARLAAAELQRQLPHLHIAGHSSNHPHAETDRETVELINASGADVLAVAYGCPKQDFWIERNRDRLTSVRVAIGVGGALDFISGQIPRAPQVMQRAGLEWLFRLCLEPSRFRRMLALPQFGAQVIKARGRRAGKKR